LSQSFLLSVDSGWYLLLELSLVPLDSVQPGEEESRVLIYCTSLYCLPGCCLSVFHAFYPVYSQPCYSVSTFHRLYCIVVLPALLLCLHISWIILHCCTPSLAAVSPHFMDYTALLYSQPCCCVSTFNGLYCIVVHPVLILYLHISWIRLHCCTPSLATVSLYFMDYTPF
jgi:hypothetical protein